MRRATCAANRFQGFGGFLSTLSLRRATVQLDVPFVCHFYFYPRSPCGERRYSLMYPSFAIFISIHALLAESDWDRLTRRCQIEEFLSTLSLRRATCTGPESRNAVLFLSTLSLRRATGTKKFKTPVPAYFYPRSPCGERQFSRQLIHRLSKFLSTLSLRRATFPPLLLRSIHEISIHALLAESDLAFIAYMVRITDFYPRSPCGERQRT